MDRQSRHQMMMMGQRRWGCRWRWSRAEELGNSTAGKSRKKSTAR